jgi:hypothetical protein
MNVPHIVLHPAASAQLDTFVTTPSHAVLLSGAVGSGKTHIAEAIGLQLLGTTTQSIENQAYLRNLRPQKGSIGIEQIRELTTFFRLSAPGHGRVRRVAVIQDADTMGHEAQNALLKLLEEPPEASVLVLTSSRPQTLLATIRSRTQLLQLPSPDKATLLAHFISKGYSETTIRGALLRSGANIAAAEQLLSNSTDTPDTTLDLVKQVLGGTSYDRMLLVDGLAKQKETALQFVDTLATVAMASLEASAAKGVTNLSRWNDVLAAAHTAQEAFERSGNAKLVLTELMLAL